MIRYLRDFDSPPHWSSANGCFFFTLGRLFAFFGKKNKHQQDPHIVPWWKSRESGPESRAFFGVAISPNTHLWDWCWLNMPHFVMTIWLSHSCDSLMHMSYIVCVHRHKGWEEDAVLQGKRWGASNGKSNLCKFEIYRCTHVLINPHQKTQESGGVIDLGFWYGHKLVAQDSDGKQSAILVLPLLPSPLVEFHGIPCLMIFQNCRAGEFATPQAHLSSVQFTPVVDDEFGDYPMYWG